MEKIVYILIVFAVFTSCTKDIVIDDIPDPEPEIVVEGTIEPDEPPFVLLTKNSPYFGGIDVNDFSAYFVRGAKVTVWTETDTVLLIEICTDALPDDVKQEVAASLGYNFEDSVDIPAICFYTVPDIFSYINTGYSQFMGKPETNYYLRIEVGGKVLTSKTYIPAISSIDLSWKELTEDNEDSLVIVSGTFSTTDTVGNFIRYFTQRNSEPMYPPLSASVYDDLLFEGGTNYTLPLERGQDPLEEIDFDTYSYFWRGDTVIVKWSTIDRATYNFWSTLEMDGGSSPFSSPIKVRTNINGGLGIWAGYGSYYATIIIPY